MVDYSFNLILTESTLIFIANLWIWRLEKVCDKMLNLWNRQVLPIQSSFQLWRKEIEEKKIGLK